MKDESVDLNKIDDVDKVKVMKSDEYDALGRAQQEAQTHQQNIALLSQRQAQLEAEKRTPQAVSTPPEK
jgi:hypothetical protein